MTNWIEDSRVESALVFLRDNAPRLGELKGKITRLEMERKVIRSQGILQADEDKEYARKAAPIKQAYAEDTNEMRGNMIEMEGAIADLHTLQAQMKAAELTLEVWRSLSARERRAHV